jgi:hypothetical protein
MMDLSHWETAKGDGIFGGQGMVFPENYFRD